MTGFDWVFKDKEGGLVADHAGNDMDMIVVFQ
jgi:hypothetical protein